MSRNFNLSRTCLNIPCTCLLEICVIVQSILVQPKYVVDNNISVDQLHVRVIIVFTILCVVYELLHKHILCCYFKTHTHLHIDNIASDKHTFVCCSKQQITT